MAFQNMTNEQVFLAISTLATVSVAIVAVAAVILQTRQFNHDKKVAEAFTGFRSMKSDLLFIMRYIG